MPDTPARFAFLLLPGFALMSYASAVEPLRAANVLAGRDLFAWLHLSPDGRPVAASNGATLAVEGGLERLGEAATILVCAGGNPALYDDPATFRALRAAARRGLTVGGVSGGPFVLARAGLLDGYRATVHWEHAPAFAEAFPRVSLVPSLFQIDRRRLTCAGGVAALDMMHAVVAARHGTGLSDAVTDWFLAAHVRPGSGQQRRGLRERLGVASPRVEAAVALMERRIEEPASRAELAAAAGISPRQLDRLFARHLAASPERFYLGVRLERAHDLLAQTTLSVTQVAVATGFASPSHFARAFRARYGRAPRSARAPRPSPAPRAARAPRPARAPRA
ncbi:GlxA family transcriptional regulator, partial [Methylobacterium crusticola]